MKISLGPYSKAVTAAIGLALAYATQHYAANQWVAIAVAAAAALGVYAVPNAAKPPAAGQGNEAPPPRM